MHPESFGNTQDKSDPGQALRQTQGVARMTNQICKDSLRFILWQTIDLLFMQE